MRRPSLRGLHCLAVVLSLAACTATPTILPTNDLNRPTDIAFMCLGAYASTRPDAAPGTLDVSGRPMSVCHKPPVSDYAKADMQPKVSMENRTFAFVANSASGDLSVVDADTWKIIDLNKATGGFGRLPLGALPEQISTTTDGCRLVSANRGSCDLSLVDPSTLLAPMFAATYDSATTGVSINVPAGSPTQTITPHWGDTNHTPLKAAPYEAVFLPQDTSQINNCPLNGAGPTAPWRALVTYPSCNLVALVDLPTGDIVSAFTTNHPANSDQISLVPIAAGTIPSCPDECGTGRAAGVDPDAGVPDSSPRPTGIAIWPDATRAYISFANVPAVLPVGLSQTGLLQTAPNDGIPLHEGAQGSNRIRLGVDPYGQKTEGQAFPGRFVGDSKDRGYLYVIARDGSLRIVDVFEPGAEKECETNFDALDPGGDGSIDLTASNRCIPYGSVNRRPYSQQSAGLRFPTFPVDVAVADMGRVVPGEAGDHREDTVAGAYAWVLTANGLIYLVNIDPVQRSIKAVVHERQKVLFDPDPANVAAYKDDPFVYKSDPTMEDTSVKEPPPFPNRPRDRNLLSYSPSLDPALGLVRVDIPPIVSSTGAYIEPLYTFGTELNATVTDATAKQTFVFFPDRDGVVAQSWDVIWQGTLVPPRYSGVLRGNLLKDGGGGFCTAGVQVGDIVTLNGCTADSGCPLGMVCRRESTLDQVSGGFTVTGLCVSANKGTLEATCAPYVNTVRRYEIVEASNSQLRLTPHIDEVVRSSLTPCEPGDRNKAAMAMTGTGGTGGTGAMTCASGGRGGAGGIGGAAGMGGTGGTGGSGGTGGMSGSGGAAGSNSDEVALDTDCVDPLDQSTSQFRCVDYQGQRRCLDPCTKQQDCRSGRICRSNCAGCPSGECAPDGMCIDRKPCTQDDQCPSQICEQKFCRPSKDCSEDDQCPSGHCEMDMRLNKKRCTPRQPDCTTTSQCGDFRYRFCNTDGNCEINSVCVDGPELGHDECFPQLTGYQVNVNAGFMVTGSQVGSMSYGIEQGGKCAPDPNRDPRLVSRIPLRPAPGEAPESIVCDTTTVPRTPPAPTFPTLKTDPAMSNEAGFFIDHFDPRLAPVEDKFGEITVGGRMIPQESTQLVEWMNGWIKNMSAPNACIYMAGPVQGDPSSQVEPTTRQCRPQHVRARFRNTQIAFVIANLDRGPPNSNPMHFEVHGGFRPQAVVLPTTVEINAPARLVLGPIDSNQEAKVTPGPAPYFFVVDQRRLGRGQGGGPTRGQIVRVNPFGLAANGYLPIYEDYSRSGNLFPIQ